LVNFRSGKKLTRNLQTNGSGEQEAVGIELQPAKAMRFTSRRSDLGSDWSRVLTYPKPGAPLSVSVARSPSGSSTNSAVPAKMVNRAAAAPADDRVRAAPHHVDRIADRADRVGQLDQEFQRFEEREDRIRSASPDRESRRQ